LRAKEILVEFYDMEDDKLSTQYLSDTRRPRLTFHHLQRLRKSKDIEKVEKADHLKSLPDMYGPSATEQAGL
jgi:hypothetical protein